MQDMSLQISKFFSLFRFCDILTKMFSFFHIHVKLISRQGHILSLIATPFNVKIPLKRKIIIILRSIESGVISEQSRPLSESCHNHVYGQCRILLPWLREPFFCNPGLKNCWFGLRWEPTTLDLKSGTFKLIPPVSWPLATHVHLSHQIRLSAI